jgi:Domain of unknown function (DUF4157)
LHDDDAVGTGSGMSRSAFMSAARRRLSAVCDAELAAVGRSSEGCPYLDTWLAYYEQQSAGHITQVIRLFTGVSSNDPEALLSAITERVRGSVRTWIATGSVSGLPAVAPPGGLPTPGTSVIGPPTVARPGEPLTRSGAAPGSTAIQRARGGGAGPAPPNTGALREGLTRGRPLESGLRGRMERGFGRSFADVRVHADPDAGQLAASLAARAFTIGQDIIVPSHEYRPGTVSGDALVAHELAHTIQQGQSADLDAPLRLSEDSGLEHEADHAAAAAIGAPGSGTSVRERRGLGLQGCSQKAKACPAGYEWYPTATAQWGSLGCTCFWKCLRQPPSSSGASSGQSYSCPADQFCDDPYNRVSADYTKKGYGAAFTPLPPAEPACGCFPLDIEGKETAAPLVPVTLDVTAIAGPMADIATGIKARQERARSQGGTSGAGPQTDPRTGRRFPGSAPKMPHPLRNLAIQEGLYTSALMPRLDKIFLESDPAVMAAMQRTMEMPAGGERSARLERLLSWAESRPELPGTVSEGATFGKGGTGSVAEVSGRPDLASKTGAGRAGTEAEAMVELELAGIPTVYLGEGKTAGGAQRLVLRRIDGVGSKETIGREGQPPADLGIANQNAQYITPKTIADLEGIYQKLDSAKMNVGDFQFIIRKSDGAVFVNDPTGFTSNSAPSGSIRNIIDRCRAVLRRRTEGQAP